jgi:hypothetical protein
MSCRKPEGRAGAKRCGGLVPPVPGTGRLYRFDVTERDSYLTGGVGCRRQAVVETTDRLRRMLVVKRGELHVSLSPNDVELLVQAIDVMVEGVRRAYAREEERPGFAETLEAHVVDLDGLRRKLIASSGTHLRPWSPGPAEAGLLRGVLSDITGYQRGDLTAGLRELRVILSVR